MTTRTTRTIRTTLRLESLETREVPANFIWQGDVDNLFSTAGNWVGDAAPTGADDDLLIFPDTGVTSFTPQDDLPGVHRFFTVEFVGTGYTLSGTGSNTLTATLIGNKGANNTIDASLALARVSLITSEDGDALSIHSAFDLQGSSVGVNGNVQNAFSGNQYDGKGSVTFTGVISDTGATPGTFRVVGGTVVFSGTEANTYTGETLVFGGLLELAKASAGGGLGDPFPKAVVGNLVIGSGTGAPDGSIVRTLKTLQVAFGSSVIVNSDGKFDLNGKGQNFSELTGTGTVDLGTAQLTVSPSSANVTFDGTILGSGEFQLFGAGTGNVFALTATHGYTGLTGVNTGTLLVNGSIATSSQVRVRPNGILGGTGVVSDVVALNGSRVAPGESPGILNTGAVVFNASLALDIEIGGNTAGTGSGFHDQLNVSGTVVLATTGNGVRLNLTAFGTPTLSPGQLILVNNDGTDAVTGTFRAGAGADEVAAGSPLAEGALVSKNFLGTGLTATITYVGGDGNDLALKLTLPPPPPPPPVALPPAALPPAPPVPAARFALGGLGAVQAFDAATKQPIRDFVPYEGYSGGISVALADVNADGILDLVTGTAVGASHVKVFDWATGELLHSFLAFDGFAGGVTVAAGDVDGDGRADIIVGTATGFSHVKVFSGATGELIRSFLAFDGFTGGVTVAAGDIDGDGLEDIVVGTATGAAHVKAFRGTDLATLASYFAFAGFTGGVNVAAGNLDGNGVDEILVGTATAATHVKAFTGAGQESLSFFAAPGASGVRVGATDLDGNGSDDVIAASGTGAVELLHGTDLASLGSIFAPGVPVGGPFVGPV